MKTLISFLQQFLNQNYSYQKPLLLGYSGGGDSEALLQALLLCREKRGFDLHLAHIDHGWREVSKREAFLLQEKAKKISCPFHLGRASTSLQKNQEAEARSFRYHFFFEIYKKRGCEALLLAHQAEDLAETVLKRVLEGAHLFQLGGMRQISYLHQMKVFRPFLPFSKKQLIHFLQEKKIPFLEDSTNQEEKYLRAKMRLKMFPWIQAQFGKNPLRPLSFLARQSWEIQDSVKEKLHSLFSQIEYTAWTKELNLPKKALSVFEYRFLIYTFFEGKLSKQQEEDILQAVIQKKKCFSLENAYFLEQDKLIWLYASFPSFPFPLKEGVFQKEEWKIKIRSSLDKNPMLSDWKEWRQGKLKAKIPQGNYRIKRSSLGLCIGSTSLRTRWAKKQIPHFIRNTLPVLFKDDILIGEFGTGTFVENFYTENTPFWEISVYRNF